MSKTKGVAGPKVVVIGAGSLFFGRQALWQMTHSKILNQGTLAYVDTDAVRLDKMMRLAKKVIAEAGVPLKLEGSADRRDVLKGADFVVLTFADRGVEFRKIDCEISAKYGVRMCSGDTIGPGGIFRAMRSLPVILECAKDVERLCPNAWVINYINPAAVNGIGLMRHAPKVKSFALCDGLHMPHVWRKYMKFSGVVQDTKEVTPEMEADFDLRISGVNHFTWALKAMYKGKDVMPNLIDDRRKAAALEKNEGFAKSKYNQSMGVELCDLFGAWPACMAHTKEYVPYWQGYSKSPDKYPPLSLFETDHRQKEHDKMWVEIDEWLDGKRPLSEFFKRFGPDHATDVIETMAGGLNKPFYIQTANKGAVSNFADDAFFEQLCDVDMNGPRPRPVGEFPVGLRAFQQLILDVHELTVEAIVTGRRDILRRAMMLDPIVNSIVDGDKIIAELLEAEADGLPEIWRKPAVCAR